jgi:carbon monoxide dehydrogenase subunit G
MKLEGDYVFEAPVQEVWDALMDPVVLAAVMPGCDKLELVDGAYVGELNIKIGPIQGKFAGKVDLKDVEEREGYSMTIDGRGAPGFVKATATVQIEAAGTNTKMLYNADAQVGGKIASVGQRLLDASAKAIAKQTLEGLHENIKVRHKAALEKAPTPAAEVAEKDEAEPEKAEPPKEPAAEVAEKEPPKAPPPVVKVDQAKLAASVAKEVSKQLVPAPVLYGGILVAVIVVLYFILRS